MWRTWPNVSEQFWWLRLRWRSTREIQRCWWTCSTASPNLTPARLNYARPGWTAWPESTWRTETCQRSVIRARPMWLNRLNFVVDSNIVCLVKCLVNFKTQILTESTFYCLDMSCSCCLQAAMCYVHVAALVAEYLRRKGTLLICFDVHATQQLDSHMSQVLSSSETNSEPR